MTNNEGKTRVTQDSVAIVLYQIYAAIKSDDLKSMKSLLDRSGLPYQGMLDAMKDSGVIEGIGKGRSTSWRWKLSHGPNDAIIGKVFSKYTASIEEYWKRKREYNDKKNGIARGEAGQATAVNVTSIYLKERIEVLTDKIDSLTQLVETLMAAWDIKQPHSQS